ncbi:Zinc metalloprotease [endosymbiont GvMRE of Glomus versiforme]|nr:Zinc metalloprotease [endosymbiont GvMRE of Glomus versiforme]
MILAIAAFLFIPTACYYLVKKSDRRIYSGKDIIWIVTFAYLWSFLNIFIHEFGHALTARGFGYVASKISVGVGWKLFSFGGGEYTEMTFQIFPVFGYTHAKMGNAGQEIIVLAMGVITQFLFLGLVYWLLKRNKKWQETLIGYFCYHYAIKTAFWLTFVLNFPFVLSGSDWTRIVILIRDLLKDSNF